MSESSKPLIIEQREGSSSKNEGKSTYIKDSASRIRSIAQYYGLDALLLEEKPEKTPLERSIARQRKRNEQRQKNLEQIVKLSHVYCSDETASDPEQDWLYRFFDMAQEVHNSSMQKLWAQVLKREVTNPGSTSMKALKVLQDMTPKEAQILQRAASLACSFGGDNSLRLLVGFRAQGGIFSFGRRNIIGNINLGSFKLPYSSLLILFELGLMHGTELESGEISTENPLPLNYQGKNITLQPFSKGSRLIYYRFSPMGNELCKLLGNKPNLQYYDQMITVLSQKFSATSEDQKSIDEFA